MGVLSVLPIVENANACCCLWVVIGGVLAAWVMQQNHPLPITAGQGALVGLLAGLIGFAVTIVASIPVAYFQGTLMEGFSESLLRQEGMPPEMRDVLQQVGPGVIFVLQGVMMFGADLVFGTLGGLIGAAIFRTPRRRSRSAPRSARAGRGPPVPPPVDRATAAIRRARASRARPPSHHRSHRNRLKTEDRRPKTEDQRLIETECRATGYRLQATGLRKIACKPCRRSP